MMRAMEGNECGAFGGDGFAGSMMEGGECVVWSSISLILWLNCLRLKFTT